MSAIDYGRHMEYRFISGAADYPKEIHEIRDRLLPYCVAVSVLTGSYEVDHAGKTVRILPGETVFLQSFVPHNVRMTESGTLIHAHFLCCYATVDLFRLAAREIFVVKSNEVQQVLRQLVAPKRLENEFLQKLNQDSQIAQLMLILFRDGWLNPDALQMDLRLSDILQKMRASLMRENTIDGILAESGLAKTTFYKLFRERLHITPHTYLEEERFRVATLLLIEGKKVKEVAAAVGFQDPMYFSRVFRKKYGISPSAYKHRKDELL